MRLMVRTVLSPPDWISSMTAGCVNEVRDANRLRCRRASAAHPVPTDGRAVRQSALWSPAGVWTRSTSPAGVNAALRADPLGGVVVPCVTIVGNGPQRCLDLVPAVFVVESASDECRNERTAPPRASALVDVGNQMVIQLNVQLHVSSFALKHGESRRCGDERRPGVRVSRRRRLLRWSLRTEAAVAELLVA